MADSITFLKDTKGEYVEIRNVDILCGRMIVIVRDPLVIHEGEE